jgi:DNA polymerase-3 subunit beta
MIKVAPTKGYIDTINKAAYFNGTHIIATDLEVTLMLPFAKTDNQAGLYKIKPLTCNIMLKADGNISDFPDTLIPDTLIGEYTKTFPLNFLELKKALKFVQNCQSSEETRYYLNGVFFNTEIGELVATDGHRLGKYLSEDIKAIGTLLKNFNQANGFILPKKAVDVLINLETSCETINISLMDNKEIQISCNDFILRSKVIDGNFPDYTRVIPKILGNCETITINKKLFLDDYKKAKLCTNNKIIRISKGGFDRDNNGNFTIKSEAMQRSGNEADNLGRVYGYNAKNIADAFKVIDGDLCLKYNILGDATLHQCNNGALYCIMPMRVSD